LSVQLVIPAAGMGLRLGKPLPKALIPIAGRPLLLRTLTRLLATGCFDLPPIVTIPAEQAPLFSEALSAHPGPVRLVAGGAERQHSVRLALEAMPEEAGLVAIHDAARPFVSIESVQACMDAARTIGAATVAVPVSDTILCADADAMLQETPERSRLWACQTPQCFQRAVICEAHRRAHAEGFLGTDDASLARRYGHPVKLVPGELYNIKITRPEDLDWARWFIEQEAACSG